MRLSLFDLLIAMVMEVLAITLIQRFMLLCPHPFVTWVGALGFTLSPLFVLIAGSEVYRWLNWRPMRIPFCPHCPGQSSRGFYVAARRAGAELCLCAGCFHPIEVWYHQRNAEAVEVSSTIPAIGLRWPQMVGRWVRLNDVVDVTDEEVEAAWPGWTHVRANFQANRLGRAVSELETVACMGV